LPRKFRGYFKIPVGAIGIVAIANRNIIAPSATNQLWKSSRERATRTRRTKTGFHELSTKDGASIAGEAKCADTGLGAWSNNAGPQEL
jgi:hypothetical protein